MPILTNEQTFVLKVIFFPIGTALKSEGKIARLNYKDFYITSMHEILDSNIIHQFQLMITATIRNYLHLLCCMYLCMNFTIISLCLHFLFRKTNMPYYILMFSFAKGLANSYIVNNMFKLARKKSGIRQLYCGGV